MPPRPTGATPNATLILLHLDGLGAASLVHRLAYNSDVAAFKMGRDGALDVKAELHYIPVFHHIIFTFDSQLSGFATFRERSKSHQVFEMDGLGRDEAAFEVGMNDASRCRSLIACMYSPGARLLFARCKISAQAKQFIYGANQGSNPAFVHAKPGQKFPRFIRRQIDQFTFNLSTDNYCLGSQMSADII